MFRTDFPLLAPQGASQQIRAPSVHLGSGRGPARQRSHSCSPEHCTWENGGTNSGATPSAQQATHLGPHPPPPINPSVLHPSRRPLLTSPAQSFALFNQDEIGNTITPFQGLHTYTCRLLIHSQTSLVSTCLMSLSLLPSHYPPVSSPPPHTHTHIPSSPSLVT